MITRESIDKLLAGKATVVGPDGEKIGTVGQIYVDDATGDPNWVTANTGLFGLKETFIPLDAAEATDDEIRVPYTKDQVKDAPNLDPNGHINEEEQDSLYEYYSRNRGAGSNQSSNRDATFSRDAGGDAGRGLLDDRAPAGTAPDAQIPNEGTTRQDAALRDAGGQDATQAAAAQAAATQAAAPQGTTAQDRGEGGSLTRSEEQVNVGTERHESGRVRLRKYVVTENVTQTVPVSHEEVRVEREPVTNADRDATAGLGDDEQEVTLHEETPVIDKQAVPVEKVRLEKDTVRDEETVDTEVRKEQIDTERDDARRD